MLVDTQLASFTKLLTASGHKMDSMLLLLPRALLFQDAFSEIGYYASLIGLYSSLITLP